jgi:uncharacterized Fe-S radical SAM superfamily protein PflX
MGSFIKVTMKFKCYLPVVWNTNVFKVAYRLEMLQTLI